MESKSGNKSSFNTDFCLRLANHVLQREAEKGSNFVVSPFSLHLMLSLIAVGSSGPTLEQLLFYLKSPTIDNLNSLSSKIVSLALPPNGGNKDSPLLSFVNGVWSQTRLSSAFEEIANTVYKANVKMVDFKNKADQIREEINAWAENATKGLINNFLPPGHPNTQTVHACANALYFKGSWDREFEASLTLDKDFHLLNGEDVRVPFITSLSKYCFKYESYDGYKVLKLHYKSGRRWCERGQDMREFSMYFLLPHKKDGLPDLIQKLNSNPGLLAQEFELRTVDLSVFWIPKFKFSFELEPEEDMIKLGLGLVFPKDGEYIEMADSLINSRYMFHKSCIEVNEEGTEAAVVTYESSDDDMGMCDFGSPLPPSPRESFVADHPFVFMIREETSGIVFFTGAVLNPLLES